MFIVVTRKFLRRLFWLILAGLAAAWGLMAMSASSQPGLWVVSPAMGEGGLRTAPVYGEVELRAHHTVESGTIEVRAVGNHPAGSQEAVPGKTVIEGRTMRFLPAGILRGQQEYEVIARAATGDGASPSLAFRFQTRPAPAGLWVDVRLSLPQHLVVYRGQEAVRRITVSGGKPGSETPKGEYRIQNRGERFFSQKYQQGAYYWVRFQGNYLFHSLPFDRSGQFIPEEAARLGCPASHGCVRMSLEDARWFYQNVPDQTFVVIRD